MCIKQILLIALVIASVNSSKKEDCRIVTCTKTAPSTDLGVCASRTTSGSTVTLAFNQCKSGYSCGAIASGLTGANIQAADTAATAFMSSGTDRSLNCVSVGNFDKVSNVVKNMANVISTGTKDLIGKGACDLRVAASVGQVDGQNCKKNSNCYGTTECVSDKCKGKAKGSTCANDRECVTGTSCIDLTCQNQKASGESCTSEYDCANNLTCGNSKCVGYESVADNEQVVTMNACKGRMARPNTTTGLLICDSMTALSTNNCSGAEDKCSYKWTNGGTTQSSVCMCNNALNDLQERNCPDPTPKLMKTYNNVQTMLRYSADINACDLDKTYTKTIYNDCINSVFGSTAFIKSSILVILSVLAILF